MRAVPVGALVAAVLVINGCGGTPSSPSEGEARILLTPTGLAVNEVRITAGTRVLFVNNDIRTHAISSDPVQLHTDCPEINEVGSLAPGQSRSTAPMPVARTCGFHDHLNEFDSTWKGRIIVQ